MIRITFLVALLVVAMVGPASAGPTHFPGGLVVGTYPAEDSADVTPGDDDAYVVGTFEVDGASRLDGALDLNSSLDVSGAVVLNSAVTLAGAVSITDTVVRRVFIPAQAFDNTGGAADPTAVTTGGLYGLSLAIAGSAEQATYVWAIPNACDPSKDVEISYMYTPASDANANTEGQLDCDVHAIADGGAVTYPATALESVYDTPAGAQGDGSSAVYNITTSATIPAANIVKDGALAIHIEADISDDFANEPIFLGAFIEYEINKLGE